MSETTYVESGMCYCTLCDKYFASHELRAIHIQFSNNHPQCEQCDMRFANKNSLRTHWVTSPKHHFCFACDKTFKTAAGLRVHIEQAAIHRDYSDSSGSEDDGFDDTTSDWEDVLGARLYPEESAAYEPAQPMTAAATATARWVTATSSAVDDDYWDEDTYSDEGIEENFGRELRDRDITVKKPVNRSRPSPIASEVDGDEYNVTAEEIANSVYDIDEYDGDQLFLDPYANEHECTSDCGHVLPPKSDMEGQGSEQPAFCSYCLGDVKSCRSTMRQQVFCKICTARFIADAPRMSSSTDYTRFRRWSI